MFFVVVVITTPWLARFHPKTLGRIGVAKTKGSNEKIIRELIGKVFIVEKHSPHAYH